MFKVILIIIGIIAHVLELLLVCSFIIVSQEGIVGWLLLAFVIGLILMAIEAAFLPIRKEI